MLCGALERYVDEGKDIPLKKISSRFSIEVVARAGFSLELDIYSDLFPAGGENKHPGEVNPFLTNARKFFNLADYTWWDCLQRVPFVLAVSAPVITMPLCD